MILTRLGIIEYRLGNNSKALSYWQEVSRGTGDILNPSAAQYHMAELFYKQNKFNASMRYALLAFNKGQKSFQKTLVLSASTLLGKLYKHQNKLDSAYYYQEIASEIKDSLFGIEKFHKLQLLTVREQQRKQEIIRRQQEVEQEKERLQNKIKMLAVLATLGVFLLIAIILYRNNRLKQRANALLQQQKEEVEKTLIELKTTQAQLIQSEKMASLGELTAGIAHEIQNPLNFVNNFSDVNTELIEELEQEADKGNFDEVKSIANDIKENEQKINHHGKRADAIVKGMLQHSRASTGKKEPTDINALADEYLRLSYHGLRAKDKSFNADFKTDFDESIGKIEVAPQDIGRVLLNLYNNAFYAVNEKKKAPTLKGENYEPTVWVTTKRISTPSGAGGLEISVKDNGIGIPQKVVDKIFQPFFTTKPTGQGTGLGLSLSYDIITKGHGGELKVESEEGEGSRFIINITTT